MHNHKSIRIADEASAIEAILGGGGLVLLVDTMENATRVGAGLASFVDAAVKSYTTQASDEEWITLTGLLNRSRDPASALIARALSNARVRCGE